MDRLVPDGSNENDEEYNRAELSALVRIQYEERMKAQKQRDLANTLNERGGLSPLNNSNARRRRSVQVNHMANQLNAEKQRRSHEDYHSKSTRSWRRLKEELIAAADKHLSDHTENAMDGSKNHKRTSSGGFRSLLNRIPSLNSVSSTQAEPTITPALEQIAPPLEKTEVKVVEGALNMKTMCALDVYTPLRMIFAVPEDLLLTKEVRAERIETFIFDVLLPLISLIVFLFPFCITNRLLLRSMVKAIPVFRCTRHSNHQTKIGLLQ